MLVISVVVTLSSIQCQVLHFSHKRSRQNNLTDISPTNQRNIRRSALSPYSFQHSPEPHTMRNLYFMPEPISEVFPLPIDIIYLGQT